MSTTIPAQTSQVPALGYTVTYAVGNILLTIRGMVVILTLSLNTYFQLMTK